MEFCGISGGQFFIILIVAVIVLGPEAIISTLRGLRKAVDAAKGFSARVREERTADPQGAGLADLDLSALDMRDLDPPPNDPRSRPRGNGSLDEADQRTESEKELSPIRYTSVPGDSRKGSFKKPSHIIILVIVLLSSSEPPSCPTSRVRSASQRR